MNSFRWGPLIAFIGIVIASLLVGGWLRAIFAPEWTAPDTTQQPPGLRPWAVEADCYSQLARDQRILQGRGFIQSHFTVENWPEGLVPSTTAPFDYAILILWAPLALFTKHPLDWAGALVSPALWIALVGFWTLIRSREFTLAGRSLLIAGAAVMPAFIWATACGRPRHQSLILVLLAMALTAEYERWRLELTPKWAWNIFAGIVWGLACWTSLFEPLIVLGLLVVFNLVVRRRESGVFLVSLGVVMLVALLLEGVHVFNPSSLTPEYRQYLVNWLGTIAEVQGVDFNGMMSRLTLVLLVLPLVAWRVWPGRTGNPADAFLIIVTTLLVIFSTYQSRWIYYSSLAELMLLARYYQIAPGRWTKLVILAIFVAGVGDADETQIAAHGRVGANQPSLQLAEVSRAIDQPGGILAPWWLSPGLLYFSGQPIVAGSSHCGITGIVASAQFFTSTSWPEAERILRARQVRWIVVYDDPVYEYPLLNSSNGILGRPSVSDDDKGDADSTLAQELITDHELPAALHLRGVTPQLKLYEYVP